MAPFYSLDLFNEENIQVVKIFKNLGNLNLKINLTQYTLKNNQNVLIKI
jgi:hypothetical protein